MAKSVDTIQQKKKGNQVWKKQADFSDRLSYFYASICQGLVWPKFWLPTPVVVFWTQKKTTRQAELK